MIEVLKVLLSLLIIFGFGILGGILFDKIRLPRLIWYILLGILIGPSVLNVVDSNLLKVSSYLRQIALIIILTRSGLSLDIKTLKKIGRPAIMMCMVPAMFEMLGIVIFGPLFFDISVFEALLLGSVLAAVSPAVIVPRMIKLMDEHYGSKHNVCELILAGSSCDDIFVIVLFYAFKGLVKNNSITASTLLQIPSSIIFGILLGVIFGLILYAVCKYLKAPKAVKVILTMVFSFLMVVTENLLKPYVSISALLGIISMGIVILSLDEVSAKEIKPTYNNLWKVFEILLFVLVGCATNVHYALSSAGLIILGLITIALVFRSVGVIVCLIATKYTFKEKVFIVLSYIPKATVQASIGAIALSEGLACGELVLTAAVVSILYTAPIGAILIDTLYKKLLNKEETDKIVEEPAIEAPIKTLQLQEEK